MAAAAAVSDPHERRCEQHGAVQERRGRPDRHLEGRSRDHRHGAGDPGDHAELGVRLDQFVVAKAVGRLLMAHTLN